MKRPLFDPEHHELRESFGRFLDREIAPSYPEWEKAGRIPREVMARTGELGFLGFPIPEDQGGAGVDDFRSTPWSTRRSLGGASRPTR